MTLFSISKSGHKVFCITFQAICVLLLFTTYTEKYECISDYIFMKFSLQVYAHINYKLKHSNDIFLQS